DSGAVEPARRERLVHRRAHVSVLLVIDDDRRAPKEQRELLMEVARLDVLAAQQVERSRLRVESTSSSPRPGLDPKQRAALLGAERDGLRRILKEAREVPEQREAPGHDRQALVVTNRSAQWIAKHGR